MTRFEIGVKDRKVIKYMENFLNIKANWKHNVLEYYIRKTDSSHDMSRGAIFEREVKAAKGVKNWREVQLTLSELQPEDEAPIFTCLQAKYSEETAKLLKDVREEILSQLHDSIKILQTQYLIQLLQANYLEALKREKLTLTSKKYVDDNEVNLPMMSGILTQMMLEDKECDELKQIRDILIGWKNK